MLRNCLGHEVYSSQQNRQNFLISKDKTGNICHGIKKSILLSWVSSCNKTRDTLPRVTGYKLVTK